MSTKKLCIETTRDYALFVRSTDNRKVDMRGRASLVASMKKYGFLPCYPVVVVLNKKGQLVIKDGQHRKSIAQDLGLAIYYVVQEIDFDVAVVNGTAKKWSLKDYARKWEENGKADYAAGIAFAEKHKLCYGVSFALLAGTTGFSGVTHRKFICGEFTVKDAEWAESVAALYRPLVELNRELHKTGFMEACMALCRVPGFKPKRLIDRAKQKTTWLINYATRDGYLEMLQKIYNWNVSAREITALAIEAQRIMAERDAAAAKARRDRRKRGGENAA